MDERMDMKPQKPGKSISPDIPGTRGGGGRAGGPGQGRGSERESVCISGEIMMYSPLSSVIKSARCNALFGFTAISLCSEFNGGIKWRLT